MLKFTIKELAEAWSVSVPATWKRVEKIKKEDEVNGTMSLIEKKELFNNKMTTVIELDEATYNRFAQSSNDTQSESNQINESEYVNRIVEFSDLTQSRMLEATERYTADLKNLMQQLAEAKASTLLLEDKANREGLYLNEIKESKSAIADLEQKNGDLLQTNSNLKIVISILTTVLIVSLILITFLLISDSRKDVPLKDKQPVNEVVVNDNKVDNKVNSTPQKPITTVKNKK